MINVKTYEEASGSHAADLARACSEVNKKTGKSIALCLQAADIREADDEYEVPILAQHIDDVTPGSHTGYILAEDIKQAGAIGTLLNHSEHRLEKDLIRTTIDRAKETKLIVVLCAKDAGEAKELAEYNPEFIAVEPPELIGGDVSVTTRPELIKDSVEKIHSVNKDIKVLVGAGVKTAEDVKKALELGADGVLVASGVVKSDNWFKVVEDFVSVL